jgi:hypothetical protein
LLISSKAFGKPLVEPKTQGKFRKCFQKPWSSTYSTEMFSKMVWTNEVGHEGIRCWWFYKKGIGVSL